MAQFKIAVDLSGVSAIGGIINEQVFPLLNQAVHAVAQQTQINWMQAVARAKLWSGEKTTYIESIEMKMTGSFSALVWTDYRYASDIDDGRPPYDLKQMLNTSQKVRRTKDGRRFLIIPFRHNTPGNDAHAQPMPMAVYAIASQLEASRILGQGQRPSGELTAIHPKWGTRPLKKQSAFLSNPQTRGPVMVPKMLYKWGERYEGSGVKGDRHAGMVRFDTRTPGGAKHSTFLTFRVMMEGSPGWVIQAKAGQHLAQGVVDAMKPLAEGAFREAINRLR